MNVSHNRRTKKNQGNDCWGLVCGGILYQGECHPLYGIPHLASRPRPRPPRPSLLPTAADIPVPAHVVGYGYGVVQQKNRRVAPAGLIETHDEDDRHLGETCPTGAATTASWNEIRGTQPQSVQLVNPSVEYQVRSTWYMGDTVLVTTIMRCLRGRWPDMKPSDWAPIPHPNGTNRQDCLPGWRSVNFNFERGLLGP